jgi:hypothetical protein
MESAPASRIESASHLERESGGPSRRGRKRRRTQVSLGSRTSRRQRARHPPCDPGADRDGLEPVEEVARRFRVESLCVFRRIIRFDGTRFARKVVTRRRRAESSAHAAPIDPDGRSGQCRFGFAPPVARRSAGSLRGRFHAGNPRRRALAGLDSHATIPRSSARASTLLAGSRRIRFPGTTAKTSEVVPWRRQTLRSSATARSCSSAR